MDYLFIATVLMYMAAARLTETVKLNIFVAALAAVLLPEVLRVVVLSISNPEVSPLLQIGIGGAVKIFLQCVVMIGTFSLLKQREDTIVAWWCYLLVGMAISLVVVPYLSSFVTL